MDYVYLIGAIAIWFVLVRFVLPKFGVQTCMSCCCKLEQPKETDTAKIKSEQNDHQTK
jgi:hypothetical protein